MSVALDSAEPSDFGWGESDPDTLKMPENPAHRRIIETISLVAARHLPADVVCYRDMN